MILLLRHGQTDANAGRLLQGRADLPLNDVGRKQAAAARAAVAGAVAVVSSPLTRAVTTAEALDLGVPIEVDERWIEMDYGDYDGQAAGQVPAEVWVAWRQDPDFTPPGGESLRSVGVRVRTACEELAPRAVDRDIVIVSHVSPIKSAVAWALGADDRVAWRMFLGVAALTRIAVGPGGPSLHSFNERGHLLPDAM